MSNEAAGSANMLPAGELWRRCGVDWARLQESVLVGLEVVVTRLGQVKSI